VLIRLQPFRIPDRISKGVLRCEIGYFRALDRRIGRRGVGEVK
jgi:hypothetical protein